MPGHSVKLFDTTAERKDDLAIGRLDVMVRANQLYVSGGVLVCTEVFLAMSRATLSERNIPRPPRSFQIFLLSCRFGVLYVVVDYFVHCAV